jgi:sugar-specific transcriptional regulator TrmB
MIQKFLQEIGLQQKEVDIYLALLAVDSASALEISKKTNVKRTSVYPVIEGLIKKGLVSEVAVGKKNEYQAEPPERLQTYIENERTRLNEQAQLLTEIVPRLKSISRDSGERPIIKYYDGREGIIDSIKEYLQDADQGGDMYLVYPKDLLDNTFTEAEVKKAKIDRLSKKITAHSIYTYSKGDIPNDENSDRIRLLNTKEFPILCDLGVHKDRVRIHTLGKKLSAIYIKNADFAETLKTLIKLSALYLKEKK